VAEDVDKTSVRESVLSGLKSMKKYLQKILDCPSICSAFLVVYERKFFLLHN